MFLNLLTQSPQDVLNRLNQFNIEVTDSDFSDKSKARLLVARGKTEKAKMILRELGVNVLDDPLQGKLNKDVKILANMSLANQLLIKAGVKYPDEQSDSVTAKADDLTPHIKEEPLMVPDKEKDKEDK